MYEQPQIEIVVDGKINDPIGRKLEIQTPQKDSIGKIYLSKLQNAPNIDPAFIGMFDESKFQTVPLNYDNSLFLHSLEIDDNYRKQGYGSQIMNHCHELAKNDGYDYLTLIMDKGNEPAENLYNKLGYQKLNSDDEVDFYFVKL
jgi:ribosomal protein S18 acetylase RimI-like enzyme